MLGLFFGLLTVLILFGLILTDMERKRRTLAELLDRLEPLVERGRRLHLRNLRGLNNSLFYAYNLLESFEREVHLHEQSAGIEPPHTGARFSLRPGGRLRDLEQRIAAIEAAAPAAAAEGGDPPGPPSP